MKVKELKSILSSLDQECDICLNENGEYHEFRVLHNPDGGYILEARYEKEYDYLLYDSEPIKPKVGAIADAIKEFDDEHVILTCVQGSEFKWSV